MRKLILFLIVLSSSFAGHAQVIPGFGVVDSVVLQFTNPTIPDFIPDTSAAPLWQIGRTHKSFFTTDSAGAIALMTDTLNPYHVNANNSFIIKVPRWLNPIVDFWHKYQTDSGHDGGTVEYSLDHGTTWSNIMGTCSVDSSTGTPGLYTTNCYSAIDTLTSGIPAFTGSASVIQYSRFQFFTAIPVRSTSGSGCEWMVDTFYVRFRFISDSVPDSLAGWEIDSIKIETDNYGSGYVSNINKKGYLTTYPNPSVDGIFTFPVLENEQDAKLIVYNAMGQKILDRNYVRNLDLSRYSKGVYFYRVTNTDEIYCGQLQRE